MRRSTVFSHTQMYSNKKSQLQKGKITEHENWQNTELLKVFDWASGKGYYHQIKGVIFGKKASNMIQ